jgi:hypothetical protein
MTEETEAEERLKALELLAGRLGKSVEQVEAALKAGREQGIRGKVRPAFKMPSGSPPRPPSQGRRRS